MGREEESERRGRGNVNSVFYAEAYHPIQAGSIDGTDILPHDNAVYRALLCSNAGLYDPFGDPKAIGDPYCTLFVARLSHLTTEKTLHQEMSKYGRVKSLRIVRHIVTGASRGYAFVEFETDREMRRAYKAAHHKIIDDSEIIVDYNRQRLMPGWIPRRLGGGLGGKKESGQLRFGGRERPFRAPLQQIPFDDLKRLGIPPPPEGRYMTRFQVPSPPRRERSLEDGYSSHQHDKESKHSHRPERSPSLEHQSRRRERSSDKEDSSHRQRTHGRKRCDLRSPSHEHSHRTERSPSREHSTRRRERSVDEEDFSHRQRTHGRKHRDLRSSSHEHSHRTERSPSRELSTRRRERSVDEEDSSHRQRTHGRKRDLRSPSHDHSHRRERSPSREHPSRRHERSADKEESSHRQRTHGKKRLDIKSPSHDHSSDKHSMDSRTHSSKHKKSSRDRHDMRSSGLGHSPDETSMYREERSRGDERWSPSWDD